MGCRFESCWARHKFKTGFVPVFNLQPTRTRTDQVAKATIGSTTSRFCKRSATKSSRLPRRYLLIPRESCWARHKFKTGFMPVFNLQPSRTRTDQVAKATIGSTTSRFCKRSTAKSSRLPHRYLLIPRESCWA